MIILESRLEFNSIAELFAWRAEFAPRMFLTGSGGVYRLISPRTASKSTSLKRSRPFLAQKSK
jgi:hypothetical protein